MRKISHLKTYSRKKMSMPAAALMWKRKKESSKRTNRNKSADVKYLLNTDFATPPEAIKVLRTAVWLVRKFLLLRRKNTTRTPFERRGRKVTKTTTSERNARGTRARFDWKVTLYAVGATRRGGGPESGDSAAV